MKIAIIGTGLTGLTAGYRLANAGHKIVLFEKNAYLGGLASAVNTGNESLDAFYHHIFVNDSDFLELSKELKIEHKIKWYEPKNAIYIDNRLYSFTTPIDLIRFNPISILSRFRMGMLVLSSKFIRNYLPFESVTARQWIIKRSGKDAYEKVWGPLLTSKFDIDSDRVSGTWIWNKFKLRGSSRGKNISKERLGYMDGGFITLANKLVVKLKENGGIIRLETPVEKIRKNHYGKWIVTSHNEEQEFDRVVFTGSPQCLRNVCPDIPEDYKDQLSDIKYKANLCMILELKKSLSPYYWITISQKDIPFVLIIEHTNLVGMRGYGSNILYLSRYLNAQDSLYNASDANVTQKFMVGLKKVFPEFKEEYIKRVRLHRARFAQPVVTLNYSDKIPDIKTPLDGLYLASMAQIHPEDRGLNYAIHLGNILASLMLNGG